MRALRPCRSRLYKAGEAWQSLPAHGIEGRPQLELGPNRTRAQRFRDRNEPIAYADGLLNHLDKVYARLDGVYIHEHLALAKVVFQPVVEASGLRCTIVSAVANEDFRHRPSHLPDLWASGLSFSDTPLWGK